MTKVSTDLRIEFMDRQLDNLSAEELYRNFKYFYNKYAPSCTNDPAGRLRDCLRYLKRFLTHYSPEECTHAICSVKEVEFDTKLIEQEYVYHLILVSILHIHFEDYEAAPYWAKKALDLIPFFHPYSITEETKQYIISNNENYGHAEAFFENYESWFDWDVYLDQVATFEWERKLYEPAAISNQNFQYRIFE